MSYTWSALAGCAVVVALELAWLRTGLFRQRAFWLAYGIIAFFQVLVDGWLTKLSAPIVLYDEARTTGWRVPWDIPVEDFAFGFAMCVLSLLLWERATAPRPPASARSGPGTDG